MFRINRQTNRLEPIQEATFAALQFREREHVQEWLVNHPEAFGEELLFIQKPLSESFKNANPSPAPGGICKFNV